MTLIADIPADLVAIRVAGRVFHAERDSLLLQARGAPDAQRRVLIAFGAWDDPTASPSWQSWDESLVDIKP